MFTKKKCIMFNKITIKKENGFLGLKINLTSNYFMNFKNTFKLQHNLITSCIFPKIFASSHAHGFKNTLVRETKVIYKRSLGTTRIALYYF